MAGAAAARLTIVGRNHPDSVVRRLLRAGSIATLSHAALARSSSLLWSPSGALLASRGDDTIRVWDAQGGQELTVLQGHDMQRVALRALGAVER